MNRKFKSSLVLGLAGVVFCSGMIVAIAGQTRSDSPHEHEYHIVYFDKEIDEGEFVCDECGDTIYDVFHDHINEEYLHGETGLFDINHDSVVNAKDYALLLKLNESTQDTSDEDPTDPDDPTEPETESSTESTSKNYDTPIIPIR